MKRFSRILFRALFPLLLAACTAEEPDTAAPSPKGEENNPYAISVDEALDNLDDLLAVIDNDGTRTESRSRRIRTIRTLRNPNANGLTRSGTAQSEEVLHIVNFDNDEGFAVLSADRRLSEEVYAVAESGNIDFDLLDRMVRARTENTSLETRAMVSDTNRLVHPPYYDGLVNIILQPNNGNDPTDSLVLNLDRELDTLNIKDKAGDTDYPTYPSYEYGKWQETARIKPMLRTQWSQEEPFNYYVRKFEKKPYAGCGPVALAQLITYFKREMGLSYPVVWYNGGKNSYKIDWDNIEKTFCTGLYQLSRREEKYKHESTPLRWQAVSGLMYFLGKAMSAEYKSTGTSVSQRKMGNEICNTALASAFNRVDYHKNYALLMLRDRKLPVIMSGFKTDGIGHYWLLEGLIEQKRYVTKFYKGKYDYYQEYRNLFYCNWGWDAGGDGYYAAGFFNIPSFRQGTEPGYNEDGFSKERDYVDRLEIYVYQLK